MAVKGLDLVARNMVVFKNNFLRHVNKTMENVRTIMDEEVTKNISLTDHSLEDLRKMGHPYSKKRNSPPHSPHWQVHKQSGALLKSKYSNVEEASVIGGELGAGAFVGVGEDQAPHAIPVIWGTSKMIPRDFLTGSLNNVKKEAYRILKYNLTRMVRQFNLRKTESI